MNETQPGEYDIEVGEETQETEESQQNQEVEPEGQEADSDPSPDTGENQEKQITFSAEQQRIFDEAVGKKVFKLREKEREAEALKRQLEEIQAQMPQATRPVVPDLPDPFAHSDQEYRQRIQARERAISEAAAYDARQQLVYAQQRQAEQEAARMQQEALQEQVKVYSQRAASLGVKAEELQVAGNIVAQFGIDDALVNYILQDDQGPLITKYLSQNLMELENIRSLPPTMAAVRIATQVKAKAATLKPKLNQAPQPIKTPHGAGVAPKPRGPQGATFE